MCLTYLILKLHVDSMSVATNCMKLFRLKLKTCWTSSSLSHLPLDPFRSWRTRHNSGKDSVTSVTFTCSFFRRKIRTCRGKAHTEVHCINCNLGAFGQRSEHDSVDSMSALTKSVTALTKLLLVCLIHLIRTEPVPLHNHWINATVNVGWTTVSLPESWH